MKQSFFALSLGILCTSTSFASASESSKKTGMFFYGKNGINAQYSYVRREGLNYAFSVITPKSVKFEKTGAPWSSTFIVKCQVGYPLYAEYSSKSDFDISERKTAKEYHNNLANTFCTYLHHKGWNR